MMLDWLIFPPIKFHFIIPISINSDLNGNQMRNASRLKNKCSEERLALNQSIDKTDRRTDGLSPLYPFSPLPFLHHSYSAILYSQLFIILYLFCNSPFNSPITSNAPFYFSPLSTSATFLASTPPPTSTLFRLLLSRVEA